MPWLAALLPYVWIGLSILFVLAGGTYIVAKTKKWTTAILTKEIAVLAGIAALLGGIGQGILTAVKFSNEYAKSVSSERSKALMEAVKFPSETEPLARATRISSLLQAIRDKDESSDTIVLALVQFIRSKRSIDAHRCALNSPVEDDVQAAIRVLGRRLEWAAEPSPNQRLDLSRLALLGADFSGGNFVSADFHESELRLANFSEANLTHADFTSANFDYWCVPWSKRFGEEVDPNDLFGSTASSWYPRKVRATFGGAKADDAKFWAANLSGVDFSGSRLNGAKFERANLSFTTFTKDTQYQIQELTQGCRLGSIVPSELEAKIAACSEDLVPAACGNERIWYVPPEGAQQREPERKFWRPATTTSGGQPRSRGRSGNRRAGLEAVFAYAQLESGGFPSPACLVRESHHASNTLPDSGRMSASAHGLKTLTGSVQRVCWYTSDRQRARRPRRGTDRILAAEPREGS